MFERSPIPRSFQRRDLVVPRALVGFQGIAWVSANTLFHDIETLLVVRRRLEAIGGDQLVVGVEGRLVAPGATLALKNLLPSRRESAKPVRVRRRLERIKV